MKKAIVTGANGFIGRHLLFELENSGYEIWAVVREGTEVSCIEGHANIVPCSLENILMLPRLLPHGEYECFYHLAWEGSSGEARADYELQLSNAKACGDAARAAGKVGCKRFAAAGSVTQLMYGDYLRQDGSKPEMVTCYAAAKTAAESITRCICIEQETDFLWGYISNFYGAGDRSSNIINYLIRSYLSGKVPELTDGKQKADLIHVSDVARALRMMGEKGRTGCSYYIGYGDPKPLREFVLQVRDATAPGMDSGLERRPFRGIDIDFDALDVKKLYRDTGFQPRIRFEDGIRELVGQTANDAWAG